MRFSAYGQPPAAAMPPSSGTSGSTDHPVTALRSTTRSWRPWDRVLGQLLAGTAGVRLDLPHDPRRPFEGGRVPARPPAFGGGGYPTAGDLVRVPPGGAAAATAWPALEAAEPRLVAVRYPRTPALARDRRTTESGCTGTASHGPRRPTDPGSWDEDCRLYQGQARQRGAVSTSAAGPWGARLRLEEGGIGDRERLAARSRRRGKAAAGPARRFRTHAIACAPACRSPGRRPHRSAASSQPGAMSSRLARRERLRTGGWRSSDRQPHTAFAADKMRR